MNPGIVSNRKNTGKHSRKFRIKPSHTILIIISTLITGFFIFGNLRKRTAFTEDRWIGPASVLDRFRSELLIDTLRICSPAPYVPWYKVTFSEETASEQDTLQSIFTSPPFRFEYCMINYPDDLNRWPAQEKINSGENIWIPVDSIAAAVHFFYQSADMPRGHKLGFSINIIKKRTNALYGYDYVKQPVFYQNLNLRCFPGGYYGEYHHFWPTMGMIGCRWESPDWITNIFFNYIPPNRKEEARHLCRFVRDRVCAYYESLNKYYQQEHI